MRTVKKQWEMVIFDLDGTVLRSDKTISSRFQTAITLAVNKGIKFAFATGRTLENVINLINTIPAMPADAYIIACNGALIWQRDDNKIIRSVLLEQKDITIINDFAAQINTPCFIIDNQALSTPFNEISAININCYSALPVKTSGLDWNNSQLTAPKMMFIASDKEIDDIQRKIHFSLSESYHFVRSEPSYLEVMKKDVHKGAASHYLSEYLNILPSRIIAVGDEYNDVEMLKFAGLGVAMGNARLEIQKLADWVTLTNDNEGAAYVIEHWILQK
ncbi:Cof-type HAD-IIB family hydrolase [Pantoea agglomerans]|uniref:Cof-type HAD-IIB family hydrolase n=1 Tax=Enterobacter agglomerans TaxID=549 RepID=UPI003C7E5503